MVILYILLIILGLIGLAIIGAVIFLFNRFITLQNRVKNAWAQIDVQLKKRADLIFNLVNIVKGYAKHEKTIFEEVAKLRAGIENSRGRELIKKSNELTKTAKSLFAVVENYPELKADKNFLELQKQLVKIENDIARARMIYNDVITIYNTEILKFPNNIFAGLFGFGKEKYYEIEDIDKMPVEVEFNE